jgi:Mn-dependent DtxR family transcriptional regulator
MAERLQGVEYRVFRSLLREWDRDSVEAIRVELTRGEEVPTPEIEEALRTLAEKGYVEEFEPGHWRVTDRGRAVERSLLGDPP